MTQKYVIHNKNKWHVINYIVLSRFCMEYSKYRLHDNIAGIVIAERYWNVVFTTQRRAIEIQNTSLDRHIVHFDKLRHLGVFKTQIILADPHSSGLRRIDQDSETLKKA